MSISNEIIQEIEQYGGALAWIKEVPNCKDCGNSMTEFKEKTNTFRNENGEYFHTYRTRYECMQYQIHVELGLMKIKYANDSLMSGYYVNV